MSKTIAIIPARANSKRLPGKNYKILGGIPLIAHSILFAQAHSDLINDVYVTTDCDKIKQIALKYGAKVIDRPNNLAGDFEPTVSAVKHVIENIVDVDSVVLLQPTNPLRPANLLVKAFEIYKSEKANSLFTVSRNNQKFGQLIDGKYVPFNYEIGQRSQDLEPLYFENGLLYISKSELILQNIIISQSAIPFVVNHPFSNIDIDTQEDFDYAEYLYNNSGAAKSFI